MGLHELINLRDRNANNIWLIRIVNDVILVVTLCSIELGECLYFCDNRVFEFTARIELFYVCSGFGFFCLILVIDTGPVLWTDIRALPVQCSRVMASEKSDE